MDADAIVVGGGIAGLSCAWRLHAGGLEVLLLQDEARAGGNVQTFEQDGFLLERGPHTFMASAADIFALADEVGLAGQIVPTREAAKARFIVKSGRLHKMPAGPWSFISSRLLSFRGKWRLLGEPFRTRRRGDPSDTAAVFFERRFGPEGARVLAGAFISGVYAGDPEKLSAPAAFPLFWEFEQEAGSMIRGALRLKRRRRAERKARGLPARDPRRGLFSLRRGLGQLSEGVAERLGERCRTSARVGTVARDGGGFAVETDGKTFRAPRLVLAVPPASAARLAERLDPEMAQPLAAIPMAPVAVVHLGFSGSLAQVPDGFGFLAPRGEGVRTLGVLFPSRLFDGRAPAEGDLLSGFVGGMLDPGALDLDDAALCSIVRGDLERLVGLRAKPTLVKVVRYPQAIPQLTLGHLKRMERIRGRLDSLPGLALAGNFLRGVGVKDAVGSGFEAAARLLGAAGRKR